MICIRLDPNGIPAKWLEKAERLTNEIKTLETPEERRAFLKRNAGFWSEIKDHMLQMSHGKCWYTEAPDCVADWHIDHFRPKGRAVDLEGNEHEGYAWLAFDWRNFRLCGSFPNSPHRDEFGDVHGKRDLFPLLPGCRRATWQHKDCTTERPILLDPVDPTDPNLITFDEECVVRSARPNSRLVAERVSRTADILFLDAPRLVEARKRTWRQCVDLIEELEDLARLDVELVDYQRFRQIKRLERKIRKMTFPESPFSAVARACLRAYGLGDLVATPEVAQAA